MSTRTRRTSRGSFSQRAEFYGVPYEEIERFDVFIEEGWLCHLCGRLCEEWVSPPRLWAATLDHVIPLSVIGSPGHVRSNVKTAHYMCNSSKQAKAKL